MQASRHGRMQIYNRGPPNFLWKLEILQSQMIKVICIELFFQFKLWACSRFHGSIQTTIFFFDKYGSIQTTIEINKQQITHLLHQRQEILQRHPSPPYPTPERKKKTRKRNKCICNHVSLKKSTHIKTRGYFHQCNRKL